MAHPVDLHVGARVRQRRWLLGLSQTELAKRAGVKFQQLQKYESGANRICASRLFSLALATEVPVSFFFEGLNRPTSSDEDDWQELVRDKEALNIVRAYYAMPSAQRQTLLDLARALAEPAAEHTRKSA